VRRGRGRGRGGREGGTSWNEIDLREELEWVGLLEEEEQMEAQRMLLQIQSVDHIAAEREGEVRGRQRERDRDKGREG
jgi:hypothetical protein